MGYGTSLTTSTGVILFLIIGTHCQNHIQANGIIRFARDGKNIQCVSVMIDKDYIDITDEK